MELRLSIFAALPDPKPPAFGRLPRHCCDHQVKTFTLRATGTAPSKQPSVLKPRPVMMPIPRPEVDPNDTGAGNPPPLALTAQIEKLVLLKRYRDALELFDLLCSDGTDLIPKASTYDALVTACIALRSVGLAKAVFFHMAKVGFQLDLFMRNRLLLMHVKCGMMEQARYLFDEMPDRDAVSCNIMMSGLVDEGSHDVALEMFLDMQKVVSPAEARTFSVALRASAGLADSYIGRQLHSSIIKMGFSHNIFIACALINMYSKCGCIEEAQQVFQQMPAKTPVAWNTIIAGFALNGQTEEALALYFQMRRLGVKLDQYTYSTIFRVCVCLASLEHAKQAHASLLRHGFGSDIVANTALVDLYCKWGRMEDARHVFDKMPKKNVISWNAIIGGYGCHGKGEEAIEMFGNMVEGGIAPNHVTFLALLGACSSSGMVDKGRVMFKAMTDVFGIEPRPMHYTCLIELLGREGHLDEALALVEDAPTGPKHNMWRALLTACRFHKNVELARLAAEKLVSMETVKSGNYATLFNIYSSTGKSNEASKVMETMERNGLKLHTPCSWIEIHEQSHQFLFSDTSHPEIDMVYKKLDDLMDMVADLGYAPREEKMLSDVVEHEENMLSDVVEHVDTMPRHHSEKLAIAFGLLKTSGPTLLQVVQGHRICSDCHEVIKLFSLATGRDFVIRDSNRFHHFKEGICSCGDYW